jgi:hypothetical protein
MTDLDVEDKDELEEIVKQIKKKIASTKENLDVTEEAVKKNEKKLKFMM